METLSRRAAGLVEQTFHRFTVPLYFRAELTREEQTHQRAKPLPYLLVGTRLVREFALKTIVEIGSMRAPMPHALNAFNPICCNDGHSTLHWASTGAEVHTVDVDPGSAVVIGAHIKEFPNIHASTGDGIAFLRGFSKTIDVLYLDAWDVIPGTDYAERHLEAYQTAAPLLARSCLIQIDDTDILNGGKGRLVIPQMIRDGFTLITWGRQTLLTRD